ncbi:unnamed protein product [Gongylonema pulchrum]|uniref:C-type lectin domain-containing protein n=1 Tax=Gongylonema pulchrum TaxID=637853 RepID=A0A183D5G2_9BILA|nr:unnamed protein product [Gongylonema pulchrum]
MDALLDCASKGAFLASIHSDEENDAVKDLLMKGKVSRAYIGLQSKKYDVAQRYWSDGTPVNYFKWMSGKPDNGKYEDDGCVVISAKGGFWDDWACEVNADVEISAAVCQINKRMCPEGFAFFSVTNNCYRVSF